MDDGVFVPTKDCLTWEHYEMEDQTRGELVPFSLGRLPDWMLVVQGCFAHLRGFRASLVTGFSCCLEGFSFSHG